MVVVPLVELLFFPLNGNPAKCLLLGIFRKGVDRLFSQKGDNQAMLKDEISDPVNAVVEVDDNGGSVIKESIRKMKLRQRRVFAVRDFPPYCGLNATEPSEEERVVINGKRSFGIEDTL
ncbi:hypothetical protein L1887_30064 [Cichorium endivia]|nr:hypothetical protein L1887_30064 [Cichorium endivia]